jgi:hypothetical protein
MDLRNDRAARRIVGYAEKFQSEARQRKHRYNAEEKKQIHEPARLWPRNAWH